MHNNLGYDKDLFILPFDHRSTFLKLLNVIDRSPTNEELNKVKEFKNIIYEAFKKSLLKIPKEKAAILVDEQFGDSILKDAVTQGFITILTTEKSGQKEFTFEYGDEFAKHIEKYKPKFAKALIRYKPQNPLESKKIQQKKLKQLCDFCHSNGYKFLLEVLIFETGIATSEPMCKVIKELQDASVEPDVWKMEGMENKLDYETVINQIQKDGRENVGLVVLGRGGDEQAVEKWIKESAKVKGVIGFAVGRTFFQNPLLGYKNGTLNKEQAVEKISNKFIYFYNVFVNGRVKE